MYLIADFVCKTVNNLIKGETVRNAFRFGNFALTEGDEVNISCSM